MVLFGELNRLIEIRIKFLSATHCEGLLMIDKYRQPFQLRGGHSTVLLKYKKRCFYHFFNKIIVVVLFSGKTLFQP